MSSSPFDIRTLLDPAQYPWPVDTITLIETHISWVLLAGDRVVKLKKPVDLGFVDFRDPVSRKRACENEVRLNQRLAHDIYLGVIPITANGVDAPGEPLEWATLMHRMPADRMLDLLLERGDAPPDLAMLLADLLIPFHRSSPETHSSLGTRAEQEMLRDAQHDEECPTDPDVYLKVLTDNLDQVASAAGDILGGLQLELVDQSMRTFMTTERSWLEARFPVWLREGHGDLRCEHICLQSTGMQIYDCVEFEIAIRCADVASDLAFLLMDLRRLGARPIADELLQRYRAAGFILPQPIVDLYAAHRALVRAKVAALERSGNDPEHDLASSFEAASYLDLATAFACPTVPLLILISGLSGSGKSTVAAALGRITGGTVLPSDRVRKELAGIDPSISAQAPWHEGIYADDWTARTYDRLFEMTGDLLDRTRTTIVDATFLDNEQRERFAHAARTRGIPSIIVWTESTDATARKRLARRAQTQNSFSDATVTIRARQQEELQQQPLSIPENTIRVTVDTNRNGPVSLDSFFTALQKHALIGALQRERENDHA